MWDATVAGFVSRGLAGGVSLPDMVDVEQWRTSGAGARVRCTDSGNLDWFDFARGGLLQGDLAVLRPLVDGAETCVLVPQLEELGVSVHVRLAGQATEGLARMALNRWTRVLANEEVKRFWAHDKIELPFGGSGTMDSASDWDTDDLMEDDLVR